MPAMQSALQNNYYPLPMALNYSVCLENGVSNMARRLAYKCNTLLSTIIECVRDGPRLLYFLELSATCLVPGKALSLLLHFLNNP